MTGFSANRLPYLTDAAKELMTLARPDYEAAIEDLMAEEKGVFALPVFTVDEVKNYLVSQGHKMGRNGLHDALHNLGYHKHKGTKKVDGKTANTPVFFSLNDLADVKAAGVHDYYTTSKNSASSLEHFVTK
jgi:hypothetical protein